MTLRPPGKRGDRDCVSTGRSPGTLRTPIPSKPAHPPECFPPLLRPGFPQRRRPTLSKSSQAPIHSHTTLFAKKKSPLVFIYTRHINREDFPREFRIFPLGVFYANRQSRGLLGHRDPPILLRHGDPPIWPTPRPDPAFPPPQPQHNANSPSNPREKSATRGAVRGV